MSDVIIDIHDSLLRQEGIRIGEAREDSVISGVFRRMSREHPLLASMFDRLADQYATSSEQKFAEAQAMREYREGEEL